MVLEAVSIQMSFSKGAIGAIAVVVVWLFRTSLMVPLLSTVLTIWAKVVLKKEYHRSAKNNSDFVFIVFYFVGDYYCY
jgi:TctA family transporter